MNLETISTTLFNFCQNTDLIYLRFSDVTDFRSSRTVTLQLESKRETININIPKQRLNTFLGMLGYSLFESNKIIMSWDIKRLFSYFKFNLGWKYQMPVQCKIFDLKYMEAFCGIEEEQPQSYEFAVRRLSALLDNEDLLKINSYIYFPLAVETIPSIETHGVIEKDAAGILYCYYDIEGQLNGRLKCMSPFAGCFNPHTLSGEQKSKFVPGYDKTFLIFDYKHNELSVLAWLSKDKNLNSIIESGEDVYESIFKTVSNAKKCSQNEREMMKDVVLKVIYGMQAPGLAKELDLSEPGAKFLIDRLNKCFPQAFDYLKSKEIELRDSGEVKDYFGRSFKISSGRKPWSVRNAVIQGPAAIICLDKLITLQKYRPNGMEIVASVHDGYICIANEDCFSIAEAGKEILEQPCELAPGLKFKIGIRYGKDWSKTERQV